MRRMCLVIVVVGLALATSGCTTVAGDWQFKSIRPESAKADFAITSLVLAHDGAYTVDGGNGGPAKHVAGQYEYDAKAQVLTLKEEGGETQMYHAEICGPCGTLRLWNADDPMRWEAFFTPKK